MDKINTHFLEKVLAACKRQAETYGDSDGIFPFVLNDAVILAIIEDGVLNLQCYAGVPTFLDVSSHILEHPEIEHPQTRIYRKLRKFHSDLAADPYEYDKLKREIWAILEEDYEEDL